MSKIRTSRTKEEIIAGIQAKAKELGIKPGEVGPSTHQLGAKLAAAARRRFGGLAEAQEAAGYRGSPKKVGGRPRKPKPEPTPEPEVKLVVWEPLTPHSLTREELAREREGYHRRRDRALAAERPHQPLPGTPKERSRAFRVRSAAQEREEDRRAAREILRIQGAA